MPKSRATGLQGLVFVGIVQSVAQLSPAKQQTGVFLTTHSLDMKILETDQWLSSVAGYVVPTLCGLSFYELVHAEDIENVSKALQRLYEQGQCEIPYYRLLCLGGGYVWLYTRANIINTRTRHSVGEKIVCTHTQISEVINRGEVLARVQQLQQLQTTVTKNISGTNQHLKKE